jgi:hypothetical protein
VRIDAKQWWRDQEGCFGGIRCGVDIAIIDPRLDQSRLRIVIGQPHCDFAILRGKHHARAGNQHVGARRSGG